MNLADLYMYVSTEIGWLHLANFVAFVIIGGLCYKVYNLNKQIKDIWHWCELTEELDKRTHKRIEKLERH